MHNRRGRLVIALQLPTQNTKYYSNEVERCTRKRPGMPSLKHKTATNTSTRLEAKLNSTMPPRTHSERSDSSPISVMRWSDDFSSCSSTSEARGGKPLVKSLRFDEGYNEVFEITHLDDIPDEEVALTWYDSNEYAEIKASYQLTIFMMESGEKLSGDHTPRGLEYRTQEGAWARYENKRDAYNAVLDEQDRQWQRDEDDHDEIARIYLLHSTKCAEAAVVRATDDEKEAMEILRSIMPPKKSSKKKKTKSRSMDGKATSTTAQEVLRERSSTRRTEIRDDIKKLKEKGGSAASSTRQSTSRAVVV